ncbi:hypothetical protein ANCCEY_14184 [Ancylostoma ceylanicum]|uniref:Uncharacterized protein n=1 Tax=Ancylostoma ceylanicum TaxID=53326 RepID=A0A0D6LGD4_9BILA|nr:hypothetical protein ANCCEY_14184 [Ancylostoma ceylanicum]
MSCPEISFSTPHQVIPKQCVVLCWEYGGAEVANYGLGGHCDPHFDFARVANYGLGGHCDPHFDFARIANYGIGGHYAPHFDMSTITQVRT